MNPPCRRLMAGQQGAAEAVREDSLARRAALPMPPWRAWAMALKVGMEDPQVTRWLPAEARIRRAARKPHVARRA